MSKKEGVRVDLQVTLPKERVTEFWEWIRRYERRDPAKIHVRAWFNAPDLGLDEMFKAMRNDPSVEVLSKKGSA